MSLPDFDECKLCHALIPWGKHKQHLEWHDDITNNMDIIAKLFAVLMGLPEEEMWER